MAITSSAKKAIKVSARKKIFNLRRSRTMKSAIKETKSLVQKGEVDEAKKNMPIVQKAIDKALKRGIIKKRAASRKKSRLVAFINNSTAK